jgi:acyl-CoA thioesterase I
MPSRKRMPQGEPKSVSADAVFPYQAYGLALLITCCVVLNTLMFVGRASAQEGTIVALGDSNTSGFGVGQQQAFPARLESMLHKRGQAVHVVNAGVPGDTFGGMLGRVDSSVPPGTKLVIVQGGYNDLVDGVPPDQTVADMRAILSRLHGRHINTVLCGFFYKDWDDIGRKLAAKYQAKFVPGSTCYDPNHRGPDGLHMSSEGHKVVAERLARVLQSGAYSQSKHVRER